MNSVDTYICSGNNNLPRLPCTSVKDGCGIVTKVGSKVTYFKVLQKLIIEMHCTHIFVVNVRACACVCV